jgi:hypothetical protein
MFKYAALVAVAAAATTAATLTADDEKAKAAVIKEDAKLASTFLKSSTLIATDKLNIDFGTLTQAQISTANTVAYGVHHENACA